MKSLPPGNYALAIAHPGHELRLHGFLEQAKPFVFILTDNSEATGQDMMWDSIKAIDRATKQGMNITPANMKSEFLRKAFKYSIQEGDKKVHLKDSMIQYEVENMRTEFFNDYTDWMAQKLIQYKINYLVCDATESWHLSHEVMRMLADIAIMKVKQKTDDDIQLLDFAISEKYDSRMHEHCIKIELDDEAIQRKLHAICIYPLGIKDLSPNIEMEKDEIDRLRKSTAHISSWQKIKNLLHKLAVLFSLANAKRKNDKEEFVILKQALLENNPDFFKTEILRPARTFEETDNFKKYIKPVYGKLLHQWAAA